MIRVHLLLIISQALGYLSFFLHVPPPPPPPSIYKLFTCIPLRFEWGSLRKERDTSACGLLTQYTYFTHFLLIRHVTCSHVFVELLFRYFTITESTVRELRDVRVHAALKGLVVVAAPSTVERDLTVTTVVLHRDISGTSI